MKIMRRPEVLAAARRPAVRIGALAGTVAVALLAGLALAPSGSATVKVNERLSASHSWPTMKPQGARWFSTDPRTAAMAEYRLTTPRQGGHQDRMNGSTRYYAIRIWQEALNEQGIRVPVNGYYGVAMRGAVRTFQARHNRTVPAQYRLPVNGRIAFATSRALLAPTINRIARQHAVPAWVLCGHLTQESGLDGRAVGPGGTDFGLGQLSRRYHQADYTVAQAFDKDTAITYMARRDAAAFREYGTWRLAVVSYWSPLEARNWQRTGHSTPTSSRYATAATDGCGAPHLFGK